MLATTIDEVIVQLELIIEESMHLREREGYFAALYLLVTKTVKQKIDEGYFDDDPRMEQLDVVFANRYLTAYRQYKSKQPCSASWKVAFAACRQWKPLVLQHLFIGMNAHISLDLGIAAATVCPGASIQSLHDDFNKINQVLSSLVDTVKEEVSTIWPLLIPINWLAGKLEDEIATFSMDIARDAAWQEAVSYAAFTTDEQRETYSKTRDEKVAAFGKKIDKPGIVSVLIWVLRMFELGSVRKKIEILDKKEGIN